MYSTDQKRNDTQNVISFNWRCVLFCSLAVLDPRVGHTMDGLSPFIPVLCHSDRLFHGESCPRLDVVHPGRAWACEWPLTVNVTSLLNFVTQTNMNLFELELNNSETPVSRTVYVISVAIIVNPGVPLTIFLCNLYLYFIVIVLIQLPYRINSASEVTTLWRYTNLFITIIIIFLSPPAQSRRQKN